MNSFLEKYRELETVELLKILKQREDYQPEAVLAAEEILKSREVSELEEFELNQEADELLVAERESLHSKEVGLSLFVNRVTEVLSKWGPIHEETPKTKVVVWGVMVLLFMDFIYSCVDYKECIGAEFYVEAWEYCLKSFATEIVGIPISLYFLARRKNLGWFLALALSLHSNVTHLLYLLNNFLFGPASWSVSDEVSSLVILDQFQGYIVLILLMLGFIRFRFKVETRIMVLFIIFFTLFDYIWQNGYHTVVSYLFYFNLY